VAAANAIGCDLAAELVGAFGSLRLRVSGISMIPALCPGELVSVERTSIAEIRPGQIVVFAREGRLIAHRVASSVQNSDKPYLVTRGDRLRRSDAPVSGYEFVGRVTHVERGHAGGLVSSHLNLASRFISRLLSFSDRATYLYLRLASCWRKLFFAGRTVCRA
jgi:signal peptidase I